MSAPPSFPPSVVGSAAAAWLRAVNDDAPAETLTFYRTRYAKALLDEASAEDRRDHVHQLRVVEGRRQLRAIERSSERQLVFLLETDHAGTWQRVTMEVEASPPHLILRSEAEIIGPADELPPVDEPEAIALLDAYVTRMADRGLFSGAVAVARSGTVVYERACGLASRAFDVPNRVDTKFNLGSMNKVFTAVSIAQLVDAGKLAYGDTLAQAWPDYPNRAVAEKVTVHHLLTHTSGLGDYFTEAYPRAAKEKLRAIADFLPLFVDEPLAFEPGKRFRYSNAGFLVLGGVIQSISGQDYFDYVREHVYAPAGMASTDAFEMDHDTPNLAIGYTRDPAVSRGSSTPPRFLNNLYLHPVKGGPAGGGFSTVGDLVAFADALFRGKLVSEVQLATLTTSREDASPKWAYGFYLGDSGGPREISAGGGFAGINAFLTLFPESGLCIAALANLDPPAAQRVGVRARQLFASIPPVALPRR